MWVKGVEVVYLGSFPHNPIKTGIHIILKRVIISPDITEGLSPANPHVRAQYLSLNILCNTITELDTQPTKNSVQPHFSSYWVEKQLKIRLYQSSYTVTCYVVSSFPPSHSTHAVLIMNDNSILHWTARRVSVAILGGLQARGQKWDTCELWCVQF